MTKTQYTEARYMSCPRNCGVDVREHNSSDLIAGGCDTGNRARDAVHGEALLENVHVDRLNTGYADLEGDAWKHLAARAQSTLTMPRERMAAWFRARNYGISAADLDALLDDHAGGTEAELDEEYAAMHAGC